MKKKSGKNAGTENLSIILTTCIVHINTNKNQNIHRSAQNLKYYIKTQQYYCI